MNIQFIFSILNHAFASCKNVQQIDFKKKNWFLESCTLQGDDAGDCVTKEALCTNAIAILNA